MGSARAILPPHSVKPEVMAKTESSWTPAERQEYQKHVEASSEILKESGAEFHPRVHRMVTEHHESYDGSGFPKGLRGDAIAEASGLLHLANLFDRLCTGKQTGTELSPAEAFDYIYDRTHCILCRIWLLKQSSSFRAVWLLPGWRHVKLLPSRRVLCTPYNHTPCHGTSCKAT